MVVTGFLCCATLEDGDAAFSWSVCLGFFAHAFFSLKLTYHAQLCMLNFHSDLQNDIDIMVGELVIFFHLETTLYIYQANAYNSAK